MKKNYDNPLEPLNYDELSTLLIAIGKNFSIKEVKGEVVEDFKTKWWDIHTDCLNYAYNHHESITKDYPQGEVMVGHYNPFSSEKNNRTFGDIVKIMIYQEMDKKVELK